MAVPGDLTDAAPRRAARRRGHRALRPAGRRAGQRRRAGGRARRSALDDEAWRAAFESVFLGALRIARAVDRGIGDEGGSLAFVLSSSVKQPIAGLAASNGLRPGLAMLAKTMADELGPRGIRVNGLLPGRIDTDRVRELDGDGAKGRKARPESECTDPAAPLRRARRVRPGRRVPALARRVLSSPGRWCRSTAG